ncbi:MAG: DUF1343 domain-containing protein [Deltaproteobacteria bacterium]|nr:DUF1343 domain-containing protein [Deltaproteobacteria bacterium]
MKLGIDRLLDEERRLLEGKRLGLLAHKASVNAEGLHTVRRLLSDRAFQVTALFGPEHGLATYTQDMEAVATVNDPTSGLPVYSLYGDSIASLSPTPEMLDKIDMLIVDLQDIGSRYYTYIWTTVLAMKACAQAKKTMVICDRPNPINGVTVEGPGIARGFESFVGLHSLPIRHAMTIGEIAQYFNKHEKIGCKLEVMHMEGWKREKHWPDLNLPWINPSPNMRSHHAALLYPGMCLLEGTNVSEGRGTEAPFDLIGAPFIRSGELLDYFSALSLPGLTASAITFTPTMQKWANEPCQGLQWQITDKTAFKSYLTGLGLIWTLYHLYSKRGFAWRTEPYEFVRGIPAIDLLTGSDVFRKRIDTRDFEEIKALATNS